jgi:hypothetical protein
MPSRLESYLAEVAVQFGPLPPKQRAGELREMRIHLENAVLVNRELGQSEGEAAQNAVAQFGKPEDLGENVVWAWRRGEVRDRKSFLGAAAAMVLVLCLMTFLMDGSFGGIWVRLWEILLPRTFVRYCGQHQSWGMALTQAIFLTNYALAGGVAGLLSPKRAVTSACLGLAAFWLGWIAAMGVGHGGLWGFLSYWVFDSWTLSAVVSAWAVSRLHLAWKMRTRLVRN